MTRLTYPQEKNKQTMTSSITNSHETEQILYLKRLLVTLKQQFEKNLHELNEELHGEQSRNQNLHKELESTKTQLETLQTHHDDELKSLREQQLILRDLLRKAQEELHTASKGNPTEAFNDSSLENEILMQELEEKQKKIIELENNLNQIKTETKREIEELKKNLQFFEEQDANQELITSSTSSYQLRQEMEYIKQTLFQSAQEAKTFEHRYSELFNEKMSLEYQFKQLQVQHEHQSTNLLSFKERAEELEQQKNSLETTIQQKEAYIQNETNHQLELIDQIEKLQEKCREQGLIQEKYEHLKEEYIKLSTNLEEIIDLRLRAEKQLEHLEGLAKEQEQSLIEKNKNLENLTQEKEHLQADIQHLHELLEDTESRLKVAQQHLAKKVKEAALLVEKVEDQHNGLADYLQINEAAKSQIQQLQASVELYQKQEKKLQDQLHEALKGTESQVAKWEKKYFEMYDKWQQSENQIRELKKFEEKHLQMQNLLANLGNFMGQSLSPSQLYQAMTATNDIKPYQITEPGVISEEDANNTESEKKELFEEKYDLFGMRHIQEKSNQTSFS